MTPTHQNDPSLTMYCIWRLDIVLLKVCISWIFTHVFQTIDTTCEDSQMMPNLSIFRLDEIRIDIPLFVPQLGNFRITAAGAH